MGAKWRNIGLWAAAVLAAVGSVAAQDAGRTLRDGVFSSAQAVSGERLFESICASCHDMAEFTAAGAYLEDVEGKPLWETFEYISAEMPEDDPCVAAPRRVCGRSRLHLQCLRVAEWANGLAGRSVTAGGDCDRAPRAAGQLRRAPYADPQRT